MWRRLRVISAQPIGLGGAGAAGINGEQAGAWFPPQTLPSLKGQGRHPIARCSPSALLLSSAEVAGGDSYTSRLRGHMHGCSVYPGTVCVCACVCACVCTAPAETELP
ncbi:hypothetical protein GQ54DRAFT_298812 [Martensiomyces pterosporus]|nr:hypothetical protein GQ54DRAFT_298812 [Martensiomyces pterosporus]